MLFFIGKNTLKVGGNFCQISQRLIKIQFLSKLNISIF